MIKNQYINYVFVDDIGDIVDPNLVTNRFRKILQKNNLKHIRFHDLRHSCASLLVASKIPMKNIQEWLGHSNFNTTADVYSHLDYTAKYESANAISSALTKTIKQPSEKTQEEVSNNEEAELVKEENLDDEIAELERKLEEKRKEQERRKRRQKDFEM